MFPFQEEPDKYYGFHLMGDNHKFHLAQTYLPVGQLWLEDLLQNVTGYLHSADFNVIFGFVKELTVFNERVLINSPSKVGKEKYQAFILKKSTDEIKNEEDIYFINGIKIDFSFSQYDVSIIEIND